MRSRRFRFLLLGAALVPALGRAIDPLLLDTRQHNWALYLFTPEGNRSLTLRGDEAHPVNKDQINIVDLSAWVYSGTSAAVVTTIVLSSEASFYGKEQRASGPGTVRVIRDDCDITGEDWTYERAGEKVSIRHHGQIVINAALNGLLN